MAACAFSPAASPAMHLFKTPNAARLRPSAPLGQPLQAAQPNFFPRGFSSSQSSPQAFKTLRVASSLSTLNPPSPAPPPPPPSPPSLGREPQAADDATITEDPSCPLTDFTATATKITLLRPLGPSEETWQREERRRRPLMVYVPGMDGTGQVIRRQIPYIDAAGYDICCVYIPINDRSTWPELVADLLPLLREEAAMAEQPRGSSRRRHVTLLAESFGACLALRAAAAAPDVVSRLVLVNPATAFPQNNPLVSFCARTGLLSSFPDPLYEMAQDILLPLLVKRNRVNTTSDDDMLSPVDYVPAPCAAWRLALLNDESGLEDYKLGAINVPTLLVASAKDRVLPALAETARLQQLLPVAARTLLPQSGHTVFLEDEINIVQVMEKNEFGTPPSVAEEGGGFEKRERGDSLLDSRFEELGRLLEPWRILTSPYISGVENLPDRHKKPQQGVLFVGNHTLFGLYDTPLLFHQLYLHGFRCRGLAHPAHWLSGAGNLMERYGNVKATPRAAYQLLKDGECVLLFPGGAREVCKRKGEEYKLQWKQRADFVRMASRLGAVIVPFGAVGGDDAYDLLFDTQEILDSPIGPLLEELYSRLQVPAGEAVQPLTALPGTGIPSLVPIPRIERIYFHFGEPIDTTEYGCDLNSTEQCQSLYELVQSRVESSISLLMNIRSRDPERDLFTRLQRKAFRLLPEFSPRNPRK